MKQLLKQLVFSLGLITTTSNAQDILWEKSYGGKHAEYLFDAQPTADYGFILAGSSISGKTGNKEDASKGDLDYWVWKMDEKGDLDWQKSFGGTGVDLLQSIRITSDGGYVLAGISNSKKGLDKQEDCKGNDDFWIIKLNAKGNELWQKTIGGSGQEKLHSITITSDRGYLLAGSSASYKSLKSSTGIEDVYGKTENTRGNLDYWVVKLKNDGTVEWQKTFGGKYVDELKGVAILKNGNYLVAGTSNSSVSGDKTEENLGLNDYWLLQLDPFGNLVWQKTIGGTQDDNLFTVTATKDGGFIVGGNSNSSTSTTKTRGSEKGSDFWVVKFDAESSIQWQESYNYGEYDVLTSIIENIDETYLIGGYAQSEINSSNSSSLSKVKKGIKGDKEGINDYIALKINAKGEEIWTQTAGSNGEEVMRKMLETRDGGYLLTGTSNGKVSKDKNKAIGGNDFWVVKLKDNNKPDKEKLPVEAIPNPAVTFTNIIIGFEYEYGTANLFDISGRQLQTHKLDGSRTLPVEMTGYPSGIYIMEIDTNTGKGSTKIIKK
jgi:hypothetical protein